jgi:hypothetical protein
MRKHALLVAAAAGVSWIVACSTDGRLLRREEGDGGQTPAGGHGGDGGVGSSGGAYPGDPGGGGFPMGGFGAMGGGEPQGGTGAVGVFCDPAMTMMDCICPIFEPCVCASDGMNQCEMFCNDQMGMGTCDMTCEIGPCLAHCNQGCSFYCTEATTCTLNCVGACELHCAAGSFCQLWSSGFISTMYCEEGAFCECTSGINCECMGPGCGGMM